MKVFYSIDEMIPEAPRPVIAVGNFDGVHLGHQTIIKTAVDRAHTLDCPGIIVTFDPHPQLVIGRHASFSVLMSLDEKIERIAHSQADALLVVPFTREFAQVEPETFVQDLYMNRLNIREIVVGYSHAFGRFGRGNTETLKTLSARFGFVVHVVSPLSVDGETVNSSRIRAFLSEGKVADAQRLLGRPYSLSGRVVRGAGRGRQLEIPTANLDFDGVPYVVPKHGVYAVCVTIDRQELNGVMNIGVRPTFDGDRLSCEVHVLDFDQDIYESRLSVKFVGRIRDEMKFPSVVALQQQIRQDILTAKQMLNRRRSLD